MRIIYLNGLQEGPYSTMIKMKTEFSNAMEQVAYDVNAEPFDEDDKDKDKDYRSDGHDGGDDMVDPD